MAIKHLCAFGHETRVQVEIGDQFTGFAGQIGLGGGVTLGNRRGFRVNDR